jgi:hypothetical protein
MRKTVKCPLAAAACYSAGGHVAGTITAGVGAPAVALACNVAQTACMMACTGVMVAEITACPPLFIAVTVVHICIGT